MSDEQIIKFKDVKVVEMEVPDENDIRQFIGRKVNIDGKTVKIETICGNKITPQFFEINGQYLIGMLRFFAQMNGDKSISEKEFQEFESMEHWVEPKKTIIEVPHGSSKTVH